MIGHSAITTFRRNRRSISCYVFVAACHLLILRLRFLLLLPLPMSSCVLFPPFVSVCDRLLHTLVVGLSCLPVPGPVPWQLVGVLAGTFTPGSPRRLTLWIDAIE
jgi:hypothetical protein